MNQLCFATNLTSSELASWVQAIGSIAAIFGAAAIARYQTKRQYENALVLQRAQLKDQQAEAARTLLVLAQNSAKALAHIAGQLPDREAVHRVAAGLSPCGLGEAERLDTYISAVPLHELPHSLVTPTLMLGSVVRQFKEKVQMALRLHRQMDATMFTDLFQTLGEMNASVAATCKDIKAKVEAHAT